MAHRAGQPLRQTTTVNVTLAGTQDISISTRQPDSDDAAVGVRIGATLIYLCDPHILLAFVAAWHRLKPDAARLPTRLPLSEAVAHLGTAEPVVIVDATKTTPVRGGVTRSHGAQSSVWLRLGRVSFNVTDKAAYASVVQALNAALVLSRTAFPHQRPHAAVDKAVAAARLAGPPSPAAGTASRTPFAPAPDELHNPYNPALVTKPARRRRGQPRAR